MNDELIVGLPDPEEEILSLGDPRPEAPTQEQPRPAAPAFQGDPNAASIIKVIGVGGGGGNAVGNMYREGIPGVRYLVCNTDRKALEDSPVPNRLQLGPGLGAGGRPEEGERLAEENLDAIRAAFDDDTHMVFVTAGMGGGTGTGAGPVVAREAMRRGILTIGIVTIPFKFEQKRQIDKALDGVAKMSASVDALLIVNNERLRQVYADLSVINGFKKADETLTKAVRSIVEITQMRGVSNLDFFDVDTCLRGGGVAIMSSGYGRGEKRMMKAIEQALESPLLNDKEVKRSRSLRVAIFFPPESTGNGMMVDELNEITDFMEGFRSDVDTKWGYAEDASLTDEIKVIILASGFRIEDDDEQQSEQSATPDELEAQRTREERRDRIYGGEQKARRNYRCHLFSPEDLDNEELIGSVEAFVVARRTENEMRTIRAASVHNVPMSVLLG